MGDGQGVAAPRNHAGEADPEHRVSELPPGSDAEFWQRVREVFQSAIDRPPGHERELYLQSCCAGEEAVLREVESLLVSHDAADDFMEPRPQTRSFVPGNLVAGRYRIVKLLGAGGMGQVFEAEDEELHESVALKVIRAEISGDARMLARFKREIQLARRVTHPNVCRVYDASYHTETTGSGEPFARMAFVSMELLHGETLAARLWDGGRMMTDEALPIIRQLAAGLAAAHEASIVHRDLKSANVMLTGGAGGAERVVITDFGLARLTDDGGVAELARLTDSGILIGTPHYMAPEQLENGAVTPATDIYALGVLMYEMVTGRLPFSGTTPVMVAISRLNQKPPSPRLLVPDLDPRWEAVILRCLSRNPAARYQDANEVAAALESTAPMPRLPELPRRTWRSALWLLVPAALILTPFLLRQPERVTPVALPAAPAVAAAPRRAVAIVTFKNLSPRAGAAWLSAALPELLGRELSAAGTLRVVSFDEAEKVIGAEVSPPAPAEMLARFHDRLGAAVVLTGSWFSQQETPDARLRVDILLQEAVSGRTLGTVSEAGTQGEFLDLISRAGSRLRKELGVAQLSQIEAAALRASHPGDPDAARSYVEGLTLLRRSDFSGARVALERAIAREPSYPLSYSALAEACWSAGDLKAARAAAAKAVELSVPLDREERLAIEGRSNMLHEQWSEAIDHYRILFATYPDELTYGLHLGRAQIGAGRTTDALATAAAMRKLPPPLRDDPRIGELEAEARQPITAR
jgi:serine/threonine protein kinase/TolB-like protein